MQECFCRSKNTEFLGWFVQLIAPVLTGAKPAEILSFPNDEKHNARLESIKGCIQLNNKLRYKEFSYCDKCTKLFIYHISALDATLVEKRNLRFLVERGYPTVYSLNDYMDTLMDKMQNGIIPDEIGVFLGYPLKDVMGFIGHKSLKLTKVNGWRVYGDPRLSDLRFSEFMKAKETVKELLAYSSPDNILTAV